MSKDLPGLLLLLIVAAVCQYLGNLVVIGGKHPLEATALAIVVGIALRNLSLVPSYCFSGIKSSEKLLAVGIVLLGAGLDFHTIAAQGAAILGIVLGTMFVSFFLILGLGQVTRLSLGLRLLLAVGTTICGTSAIAVTAPLIEAREEETSYAVATVALWGLVAILVYPAIARLLGVSDLQFGVFAGTAIHSTPQVVGAGFLYSDLAGQTATAVKLVRNCFMAPLAVLLALWHARRTAHASGEVNYGRAFPWFLFGYFLLALLHSLGVLGSALSELLVDGGKFLILVGMAGIGLGTLLSTFRQAGLAPLVVGLIGALIVAAVSAGLIGAFL